MSKHYLIRLDDACPWMDEGRWRQVEQILDKYSIKPLVGIIPYNEDALTKIDKENTSFWKLAKAWQEKRWVIALHGYNHVYATACGGINPVHNRSEFAGSDYETQAKKIRKGYGILTDQGLNPTYFFAPSHTFDDNTLKVLREETPIRLVCDTIALYPYKYDKDFVIVPCQMGKFRSIPIDGYWTFCYHPNGMDDNAIMDFESFIAANKSRFISFDELRIEKAEKRTVLDRLMSWAYLTLHKLKG